jgi:hypothetical protein
LSYLVDFFVGVDLDDGVGALLRNQVEMAADGTGVENLMNGIQNFKKRSVVDQSLKKCIK